MHTDVNSVFPYVSYCQINPVSRCFIGSCRLNWTIIFHLLSLRTIHRVLIVWEKQQNHIHPHAHTLLYCDTWTSCLDVQATPMNEWAISIQRMKRPNDLCGRFLSWSDHKPARTHLIPPLLHPAPPTLAPWWFFHCGGWEDEGGRGRGGLRGSA